MTFQTLRNLTRRSIAVAATTLSLLAVRQAQAGLVTIDFDDRAPTSIGSPLNGPLVYPEATFTSSTGQFLIDGFTGTESSPNSICPFVGGGAVNCTGNLIVDFSSWVSDLVFFVGSDDLQGPGPVALVSVYQNGSTTQPAQVGFIADKNPATADRIDVLSSFTNVSRIAIVNLDPAGLTYDSFSFTSAVPVPGTVWLFGVGLVGLARVARAVRK